jgi:cytochrome c oxidase subunit 1
VNTAVAVAPTKAPRLNYINAEHGLKSWLLTKDHKRIALLYLISVTAFFFVGGLLRADGAPRAPDAQGRPGPGDTYNKFFTLHGVVMIFFFLIPSVPAVLGNFLVPLMIGAKDLAFPKINLLSWYIYIAGGLTAIYAMLSGGVDTGWTFYTPFSSTYSNTHVIATAAARSSRGSRRSSPA